MAVYTVKSGDTLASIAQRFGVTVNRLAADNMLRDTSTLVVGQSLYVPSSTERYTVQEGQTLYSLSQELGVPLEELLAANPDVNPIDLRVGQTILIPVQRPIVKRPAVLNGYAYPTINPNALNCSIPFLTFLSPFSYSLTAQGELVPPNDSDLIYRSVRSAVMPLMVVTNL
ncbi:MAG: LysM peptidoglycan-binding domain-containing protein, partial [Oscillospiraceae bacterium]